MQQPQDTNISNEGEGNRATVLSGVKVQLISVIKILFITGNYDPSASYSAFSGFYCTTISLIMKINYAFYILFVISIIIRVPYSGAQPEINKTITISEDLELIRVTGNSYIHISYLVTPGGVRVPCNGLIYVNNSEAYIIDTPVNDQITLDLIKWLENNLSAKVAGVIINHWHVDCMGGLNQIHKSGTKSYAHELTRETAGSKNLPVPEYGFNDSLVIRSGEKEILCKYFGAAHTVDNIVIWIPEEKILFGGCMIKALSSNNMGNITDADLNSYPGTLKKVINRFKDVQIVVPGHGNYGGTELLNHTLDLLGQYSR